MSATLLQRSIIRCHIKAIGSRSTVIHFDKHGFGVTVVGQATSEIHIQILLGDPDPIHGKAFAARE